jgi:4-carboxymuconolactone decarboxylase
MTEPTPAQRAIGDFAPKLIELTDNVLFGDVWERPELPKRDRSLITATSVDGLIASRQSAGHCNAMRTGCGLTTTRGLKSCRGARR